ncbi:(R)-1-hydroxy-2-aminoethylphosphonate ammonia-lyase [Aliiroseovarius sp.]|uniref:(R)-1-hydroxy-2-aminoethylphosphonate ammonia-lyase n=1 Tax=Aliiroseovarius sp. TaxID=1872442 RepID=UPI003BAD1D09
MTPPLMTRDAQAFIHQAGSTPAMAAVTRAEGAYLWTEDGRQLLDFHGNNVHHIGYGHSRVKAAITTQMEALPFAPRRFTCDPAVALAERLAALAPGDLNRVLFATGGSDAVEIALKIARAATGCYKTLSFWDSFHGAGFGAAGVGGDGMFRSGPVGPLMPGDQHVAPFACFRCPYGHSAPDSCGLTCAQMVRYVLEREGDIGAVIAEPARAAPYIPPPGFWAEVRAACDDHGALLIFDEIPTGLGKTGRMFAFDHDRVEPDILVLGKALGGGILPLAAVVAREGLNVAPDHALGHYTHEKNPVMAAAGLATLDVIADEYLVENAAAMGTYTMEHLAGLQARHPQVGDIRGRGLLIGIELTHPGTRDPDPALAGRVLDHCLAHGLSFKTTMGNILTWTPPLIVTRAQLDFAIARLDAALTACVTVS